MKVIRVLGALVLAVACFVAPAAAHALTPVPPPAKVLFSNGGRILEMNADGTERVVLFGKKRKPANDRLGATEPDVSPDGQQVVFGFRRVLGFETAFDIWVMNADGTGAKKLLTSSRKVRYGDPAFTPDGKIILGVLRRNSRRAQARIITMAVDGKSRKTLHVLKQRFRPWFGYKVLSEPVLSPNGKKLLYLIEPDPEGYFDDGGYNSELWLMDLASKSARKVTGHSRGAAWAPGGNRIVFSEVDVEGSNEFCWNFDHSCASFSRLRVSNPNGSGVRDLTRGVANETKPDWSKDGRIVFESTRGASRSVAETAEVWSVRPDGRCLTRLTNGSPASLAPVWSDASAGSTMPSSCGAKPPGPNAEMTPAVNAAKGHKPLWLGPTFRKLLLSQTGAEARGSFNVYGDCGAIPETGCGRGILIESEDVCTLKGYGAELIGSGQAQRQRGTWIIRSVKPGRETPAFTVGATGRNVFFIIGGSGLGDRHEQHRAEIDALRFVGQESARGDLPAPKIPASDIKLMKRVQRVYQRTGSVVRTAKLLGMKGYEVRGNLRLGRISEKSGGFDTVEC